MIVVNASPTERVAIRPADIMIVAEVIGEDGKKGVHLTFRTGGGMLMHDPDREILDMIVNEHRFGSVPDGE